jgi:hypothetical protein
MQQYCAPQVFGQVPPHPSGPPHLPEQLVVQTQLPPEQLWPVPEQSRPQAPQLLLSVPKMLMQPLAPQSVPEEQTQFPPEQIFPCDVQD